MAFGIKSLEDSLNAVITDRVNNVKKKIIETAVSEFRKEVSELAKEAVIEVARYYKIDQLEDEIVIRLKLP